MIRAERKGLSITQCLLKFSGEFFYSHLIPQQCLKTYLYSTSIEVVTQHFQALVVN